MTDRTDSPSWAHDTLCRTEFSAYDGSARSLWRFVTTIWNLGRRADVGKDAATIRDDLKPLLSQIARQLGREVFPDGMPWGTKLSELELIAAGLGDEIARGIIEASVQEGVTSD